MKKVMMSVLGLLMATAASNGANILIDGSYLHNEAGGQAVVDYFANTFENAVVTTANCDDTANASVQALIAAADVLVLNRRTSSGGYTTSDGDYYSTLDKPIVFLTSYVTRLAKIAFEGGPEADAGVDGAETTVTAAGAVALGVAEGTYDWYTVGVDKLGSGSVGTGEVLASIGGNNLAVGWDAGDTDGSGRTQANSRLLWNLGSTGGGAVAILPDNAEAAQAMTSAIEAYTGMVAVPEPATLSLLGLGALCLKRRR